MQNIFVQNFYMECFYFVLEVCLYHVSIKSVSLRLVIVGSSKERHCRTSELQTRKVKVGVSLSCSAYEMVEFRILKSRNKAKQDKTTTLRADLGLLRDWLGNILWDSPGEKRGPGQLFNLHESLSLGSRILPHAGELSKRRPVWMNKELWQSSNIKGSTHEMGAVILSECVRMVLTKAKPTWSWIWQEMWKATWRASTGLSDKEKCVSAAEWGRRSGSNGHGEGQDTQCCPHLSPYWKDWPSGTPGSLDPYRLKQGRHPQWRKISLGNI